MKRWMVTAWLALAIIGCGGDDDDDAEAGSSGARSGSGGSADQAGSSDKSGSGGVGGVAGVIEEPKAGMGEAGSMEPAGPGNCTPEAAPDVSTLKSAGMLKQLSTEDGIVRSLDAYDGQLYFMEDNIGLRRVPVDGGTVELIVPFDDTAYFFIGEPYLYYGEYSDETSLPEITHRLPLADTGAEPETPGAPIRDRFRDGDADNIYGFDEEAGELWKQDYVSGEVTVLAMSEDVSSMEVADDGFIYYVDATFGIETLMRVAVGGGEPEQLADQEHFNAGGVTVIGDTVYWADGYQMLMTPRGPPQMNGTVRLGNYPPGSSGFGNGTAEAYRFMEVGDRVYWVTRNSIVGWTSKDRLTCGTTATATFDDFSIADGHMFVMTNFEGIWSLAL